MAVWVIAAVALALTARSLQKVGTQDETSFLPGSSPSQRADKLLRRLFPDDPSLDAGIVVLHATERLHPATVPTWASAPTGCATATSPAT